MAITQPNATQITFIQAGSGSVVRTAQSKMRDIISVLDFGADPTGSNDSSAALIAAAAVGAFMIPPGTYKISANTTINAYVTLAGGAILAPQNGVTVTFAGGISAGSYQIFQPVGTGAVAFTEQPPFGFTEWWGCITGDSTYAASNLTAINSALVALQTTQLLAEDYWIAGTIIHATAGNVLRGAGQYYNSAPNAATRIISTSGTTTIVQMGATTNPGSINAMPQGICISDVYLTRNVAPVISSDCDGLRVQFCVNGEARNVKADGCMNSFYYSGVTSFDVVRCDAVRDSAGSGGGSDYWNGHYVDGSQNIGAAGGNASLYLTRCGAGCDVGSLSTTAGIGFNVFGSTYGFQDLFLDHCETVSCYIGTQLNGGSGGNADVRINHQTDDQVYKFGLYVGYLNAGGTIEITNYYCGPGSSAQFGIYLNSSQGAITVIGGQLLCGGGSGLTAAIGMSATGVSLLGTIISDCPVTAITLGPCSNLRLEPTITNNAVGSSGAAIYINGAGAVTASHFAPIVRGAANAWQYGVQVIGTADARNTYDLGGIDSACVSGGYAKKLYRNGASAVSSATMLPVYTGTNLITGCAG